jgi:PhnB protein
MAAQAVPEGYQTLTPYLSVDDAEAAIDFYRRAFGATEQARMASPDGKIAHAELQIGDSKVMLADAFPQFTVKPPKDIGGTTVGIFMYVDDVDQVFRQAVEAGATSTMEPEDQFWGDRFGTVTDPFGHNWQIATHVEDVPPEEMEERAKAAFAAMAGA